MSQFPATDALLASGIGGDLSALAQAVAAAPADAAHRLHFATLLFRQGHKRPALEQVAESYRLQPDSIDTVYLLIGLLSSFQMFDKVKQVADGAGALIEAAPPHLREVAESLADRARVNLGAVPETSRDPAFGAYIGAARRLAALTPVPIAEIVDEDGLSPPTRTMLDAFRAAHRNGSDVGKSPHWDRFRSDFERIIATEALWPHFRAYGLCHGLDDDLLFLDTGRTFEPVTASTAKRQAEPAPFAICTLYELCDRSIGGLQKLMPADVMAQLCEASIGGAVSFTTERFPVPVNFHDLSCVQFAHMMSRFLPGPTPCRYLEIGGGYGATAGKLKRLRPDLKAVLVDLPETSVFQIYYLSRMFPEARILTAADLDARPGALEEPWDFLILPSTRLDLADGLQFDVAANIRSFMEMPLPVVRTYMGWIDRSLVEGGICYLANRLEKHNGDELIRMADYGIPERWSLLSDQPVPGQGHIQERVYRA